MLTVEGIYKNGKVELLESVHSTEMSKVLVTFLDGADIELSSLGIDRAEAADLKAKFASFEDWNDATLDAYNDYDNAKSSRDESS